MGVDGISKADIFYEYFDDDKPKITNFQRIKSMDIDEMAEWIFKKPNLLITCENCIGNQKQVNIECKERFCKGHIKQWLLAESE